MASAAPIVLTTDFGLSDPYVGVMKGVILGINPRASIIDLTHQVHPQDIHQAALVLGTSHRFFPPEAIHVVVVDPGVGTDRRAVLLVTPTARFLAPDNGALSYVLRDYLDQPAREPGPTRVPPGLSAYRLTNPDYWLHPVSNTFHGRDVFAPVAAHLSLGVPAESLGQRVDGLYCLAMPQPSRRDDTLHGEVIYIDRFGNLTTNISARELSEADPVSVEISHRRIDRLSLTFHDPDHLPDDGLIALVGSHGYLEIAVRDGNAAGFLRAGVGDRARVRFRR